MKCDTIADRRRSPPAKETVILSVPLVVRMKGTNEDMGKQILKDSAVCRSSAADSRWPKPPPRSLLRSSKPRNPRECPFSSIKTPSIITQGITGKTGQFHTRKVPANTPTARNCFVAGVNPKKAGESIFKGIPIYASVKEAAAEDRCHRQSVIYVPPAGAAAAIWEAVEADLDLAICITEGIPDARHARSCATR